MPITATIHLPSGDVDVSIPDHAFAWKAKVTSGTAWEIHNPYGDDVSKEGYRYSGLLAGHPEYSSVTLQFIPAVAPDARPPYVVECEALRAAMAAETHPDTLTRMGTALQAFKTGKPSSVEATLAKLAPVSVAEATMTANGESIKAPADDGGLVHATDTVPPTLPASEHIANAAIKAPQHNNQRR